jgi:hypothetical protein
VFLEFEGEVNEADIKRSYEAHWGRKLEADPFTKKVFDQLNKSSPGKASGSMVQGKPGTLEKKPQAGIQRDIRGELNVIPRQSHSHHPGSFHPRLDKECQARLSFHPGTFYAKFWAPSRWFLFRWLIQYCNGNKKVLNSNS